MQIYMATILFAVENFTIQKLYANVSYERLADDVPIRNESQISGFSRHYSTPMGTR